jgi:thiol:disulfide interchange protein DsbD
MAGVALAQGRGSGPVFSASATWKDRAPAPGGSAVLTVTVDVQEGWHVNSSTPLEDYLIPTQVRLDAAPGWTVSAVEYPEHRLAAFAFSEGPVAVLEGRFTVSVVVSRAEGSAAVARLQGTVEAQACNDRLCLAPSEVPFSADVDVAGVPAAQSPAAPVPAASSKPIPIASPSEPGEASSPAVVQPTSGAPEGLSDAFLGGSLLLQLALVFVAGLALNLTPCVYPLIPITVGFFAAQKRTERSKTVLLAVAYVLGMSVTYSALGVTAALTGRLFGAALQSPWVIGGIVVVLLALAASMFGAWEIRVPAWATRLSGGRAGVGGALVMGLAVGLVAAPCIGPFVLGLLTYVGQRQDPLLGFSLFFTLSLGLGLPYLVLGISTRALQSLPNSGAWMLGVRQLFGVLLVALAGWFLRPFFADPWGDRVFAGLLVVGGLYLLLVARPGHEQPWVDRVMRLASAAILAVGLLEFPAGARGGTELSWEPYDENAVAAAMASGRPVVLDFFADWCAPCKELDERTFSDPRVAAALGPFGRFKVDLTRGDDHASALQTRYRVSGVPTIAFFTRGSEVEDMRLTGFEPPREFLRRLQRMPQP